MFLLLEWNKVHIVRCPFSSWLTLNTCWYFTRCPVTAPSGFCAILWHMQYDLVWSSFQKRVSVLLFVLCGVSWSSTQLEIREKWCTVPSFTWSRQRAASLTSVREGRSTEESWSCSQSNSDLLVRRHELQMGQMWETAGGRESHRERKEAEKLLLQDDPSVVSNFWHIVRKCSEFHTVGRNYSALWQKVSQV